MTSKKLNFGLTGYVKSSDLALNDLLENKKIIFWRKRGEINGKIDWRMISKNTYNLFSIFNLKRSKIWKISYAIRRN